jgi:hypothetical protein
VFESFQSISSSLDLIGRASLKAFAESHCRFFEKFYTARLSAEAAAQAGFFSFFFSKKKNE